VDFGKERKNDMKNREKFANELIYFALQNKKFGIKNGKPEPCNEMDCNDCEYVGKGCDNLTEWGEQEYIEPKVDWSKVPVDTPIYVKDLKIGYWLPRYFYKYENGKVFAFIDGKTSFTTDRATEWEHVKLSEHKPCNV
jgi:hypothetical protein